MKFMMFSMKYRYSDISLKKPYFILSILWNAVTVCFAKFKLVIVFGMVSVTSASRSQCRPSM